VYVRAGVTGHRWLHSGVGVPLVSHDRWSWGWQAAEWEGVRGGSGGSMRGRGGFGVQPNDCGGLGSAGLGTRVGVSAKAVGRCGGVFVSDGGRGSPPDHNLGDGPQRLDDQVGVGVGHREVVRNGRVQRPPWAGRPGRGGSVVSGVTEEEGPVPDFPLPFSRARTVWCLGACTVTAA